MNENNSINIGNDTKSCLSVEEIQGLSKSVIIKNKKKKSFLYMKGDEPSFLYFVVKGKVKTVKTNEHGKVFITEIHNEGNCFGYAAILDNTNHKESAVIMEDAEIAMLPKEEFFHLLLTNARFSLQFMKCMSSRLSSSEEKLLNIAYDSARKRVAEALLFIHKKFQVNDDLSFVINRENISSLAGIAPESVSRNLTHFREEGLIETDHGNIKIVDFKKLEMIKN